MLTEISHNFDTEQAARRALTVFRKHYRVALRGAVAIERTDYRAPNGPAVVYRLHVPLSGTGFSAAEFTGALRALVFIRRCTDPTA